MVQTNIVNHKVNFIAYCRNCPSEIKCNNADYYEQRLISFKINNDKEIIRIRMDVDSSINNTGLEYLQDMFIYLKAISGDMRILCYNIDFKFV